MTRRDRPRNDTHEPPTMQDVADAAGFSRTAVCFALRNDPRLPAADLVIEQLHHNERGLPAHPKSVLLPSEWVPGRTIRPRG